MSKTPVAVAFSGGAENAWVLARLRTVAKRAAGAVTVDTGGMPSKDALTLRNRATDTFGCVFHEHGDLRVEATRYFLPYYLLGRLGAESLWRATMTAGRWLVAKHLVTVARDRGIETVAYGGSGETAFQFALALRVFAPELTVIDPVGDQIPLDRAGRLEQALGVFSAPFDHARTVFGSEQHLWGLAVSKEPPFDFGRPVPESLFGASMRATPAKRELRLAFSQGALHALDGASASSVSLWDKAGEAARAVLSGRWTFISADTYDRRRLITFEHPAWAMIAPAFDALSASVHTRDQQDLAQSLGRRYARLLIAGQYYNPAMRDLEAAMDRQLKQMTGDVRVRLSSEGVEVLGVDGKRDLARGEGQGAGSERGLWNPGDDVCAARLAALPSQIVRPFLTEDSP